MVVDLADGVVELVPRFLEELGVRLHPVPERLDPRRALLLGTHLLRSLAAAVRREAARARVSAWRKREGG